MNLDLSSIFTNEVQQAIRILALVLAMFHLLMFLIFYRRALEATSQVSTPRTKLVVGVFLVQMLLLVGILLLIIFY